MKYRFNEKIFMKPKMILPLRCNAYHRIHLAGINRRVAKNL